MKSKTKQQLIKEIEILQKKVDQLEELRSKNIGLEKKLEESEETHKNARERDLAQKYLDIAGVILVTLDKNGMVRLINKKGSEVLGYEQNEIIGKDWFDNFLPKNLSQEVKTSFKVLVSGDIEPIEYYENPVLTKDGSERIIAWRNTILKNDEGKITGTLSSGEDITDRKKTEEELKKLSEVVEQSPMYIVITDTNGTIEYVNPTFTKITGFTKEESIGQNPRLLKSDEMPHSVYEYLWKTILSGETWRGEFKNRKKDGTLYWVGATISPSKDTEGVIKNFVGIMEDITANKKAEQALLESEERFRTLVQTIPYGIQEVDISGIIVFGNDGYHKMLGYNNGELLGTNMAERVYPESATEELQNYIKVLVEEQPAPTPWFGKSITKNGDVIDVQTDWDYKRDSNGNAIGFISIITNITDKVHAEENIINKSRVLEKLVKKSEEQRIATLSVLTDLNETSKELQKENKERKKAEEELQNSKIQLKQLVQRINNIQEEERVNISREIHDVVGQALTALNLDIAWIMNKLDITDERLVRKFQEMIKLINETTTATQKISAALRPGLLDEIGLKYAIEYLLKEFSERTGVICQFEIEPEEFYVGEELRITMYRIIQEALTNIARHAKATEVTILLKKTHEEIKMIISDNGIGISENEIKNPHSLGLLGMRERVEAIAGEMEIVGIEDEGTKIIITF